MLLAKQYILWLAYVTIKAWLFITLHYIFKILWSLHFFLSGIAIYTSDPEIFFTRGQVFWANNKNKMRNEKRKRERGLMSHFQYFLFLKWNVSFWFSGLLWITPCFYYMLYKRSTTLPDHDNFYEKKRITTTKVASC